ncbi:MAG: AAA family ATPase, partial [Candidatus Falkowbacteria bacterium]|nr:AAA family ATPase [Candidatus Falkowbacteria bacterium]
MIKREIEKRIISLIKKYAVVALVGPRQSGKSTLARHILKGKPYFSLEDLDEREFALKDPRGFLVRLQKKGGIIDEVQKCPSILSYLQTGIDSKSYGGPIIITGSTQ